MDLLTDNILVEEHGALTIFARHELKWKGLSDAVTGLSRPTLFKKNFKVFKINKFQPNFD